MKELRRTACDILIRVYGGAFAQLLLSSLSDEYSKKQRDFICALVYGSLEWQITIDARLDTLLKKKISRLDIPVAAVLRSGAYQLLFMDGVPDYAVINSAVHLCREYRKTSATGLVNAVLRRVKNTSLPISSQKIENHSVQYSLCPDIVRLWTEEYPTRAVQLFETGHKKPKTCIAVNTVRIKPEELIKQLEDEGVTATSGIAENTLFCNSAPIHTSAFKEGLFHIIGTASALTAQMAVSQNPKKVLDLCSAPGGKTAVMATVAEVVVAADIHSSRLSLVKTLCDRLGLLNVSIIQNDATVFADLGLFDTVLCDVPCTGLGVISKKPELRLCAPPILSLLQTQKKILASAAQYVDTGGILVYSTCTLSRRENEGQVKDFLLCHNNFAPYPPPFCLPPECEIGENFATFFPDGEFLDGFFVAFFKKVW